MLRIPWTAHRTNIAVLNKFRLENAQRQSSTNVACATVLRPRYRGADGIERLMMTREIEGKQLEIPISAVLHQATETDG